MAIQYEEEFTPIKLPNNCFLCGEMVYVAAIVWAGFDGELVLHPDCAESLASSLTRDASALREGITQRENFSKVENIVYEKYLKSDKWRAKSANLKKSIGKCQFCGSHDKQLHTHHNTYKRLGHEHPSDIVVLCKDCHAKFHDKLT